MIVATILPMASMSDETVDAVVTRALGAGCVACNPMRGPFRIAFFQPHRVPKGWSKIGIAHKETAPCAA